MRSCIICKKNNVSLHRVPDADKNMQKRICMLTAINKLELRDLEKAIYICNDELPVSWFTKSTSRSSIKRKLNEDRDEDQKKQKTELNENKSEREKYLEEQLVNKEIRIKNLLKLVQKKDTMLSRLRKEIRKKCLKPQESFSNMCKNNLKDPLCSIVLDQVKNQGKDKRGYRFSNATKKFSMSVQYLSPKTLRLLRQHYNIILPSDRLIGYVGNDLCLTQGVNENLIKTTLSDATKNLIGREKVVILMMDEIAVDPNLVYDAKNDVVLGIDKIKNNGLTYTHNVLVFMVSNDILAKYLFEGKGCSTVISCKGLQKT